MMNKLINAKSVDDFFTKIDNEDDDVCAVAIVLADRISFNEEERQQVLDAIDKIVKGRAAVYAYIEDGDSQEDDDRLAEIAEKRLNSMSSKPNAKTIEAIKEGREMLKKGKPRFSNPDDMFAVLRKGDDSESKPEPTIITLRGEGGVTITKGDVTPINDSGITMHPGEYFKDMYFERVNEIAKKAGLNSLNLFSFMDKAISVTPEFAISLQAGTGRSAESWLNMQQEYDRNLLKELQEKVNYQSYMNNNPEFIRFDNRTLSVGEEPYREEVKYLSGWTHVGTDEILFDITTDSARRYADASDRMVRKKREDQASFKITAKAPKKTKPYNK